MALSGTTNPGQSGLGSNVSNGVSVFHKAPASLEPQASYGISMLINYMKILTIPLYR